MSVEAGILRVVILIGAIALVGVACAGSAATGAAGEVEVVASAAPQRATPLADPTDTPTAAPEPMPDVAIEPNITPEAVRKPVYDATLLARIVDEVDVQDGTFLFAVIDDGGEILQASNGTDAFGASPTANDAYQVGSFTKVFTALATLTLVDEGLVDLDAPAADYVNRVVLPDGVTVRDLLQHTSGIFNYTDSSELIAAAYEDPRRSWTPEEIYEFAGDGPRQLGPGFSLAYSNTNYLILGFLLEEMTGQPYHEVVRERITAPLGMSSTYLAAYEEGPEPFDALELEGVPDFDATAFATIGWSAGAMVSSPPDLHVLFNALFNNEIISEELVAQMIRGADLDFGVSQFGLGLISPSRRMASMATLGASPATSYRSTTHQHRVSRCSFPQPTRESLPLPGPTAESNQSVESRCSVPLASSLR